MLCVDEKSGMQALEHAPAQARARLLVQPLGLPEHIERCLTVLESLNEQIAAADVELADVATEDECAHRLMSVPGEGPVPAMRFLAATNGYISPLTPQLMLCVGVDARVDAQALGLPRRPAGVPELSADVGDASKDGGS